MAQQNVIALVFDCDETLCHDTTDFVLITLGQDLVRFWQDVSGMVASGWDPPLAYMTKLLEVRPGLKLQELENIGQQVQFYQGVKEMFAELKQLAKEEPEYEKAEVTLKYYVISAGLEEVIGASALIQWGVPIDNVFGCNYAKDSQGKLVGPKSTITFTEKTKYLYAINKGIIGSELRSKPYLVNSKIGPSDRRIPFENIIYLGDGFSDIPCFSMLERFGGIGVGVFSERAYRRGYELAISRRISAGPYKPEYDKGSDLRTFIEERIRAIADSIVERRHEKLGVERTEFRQQVKLQTMRRNTSSLGINVTQIRMTEESRLGRALNSEEEIALLEKEISDFARRNRNIET